MCNFFDANGNSLLSPPLSVNLFVEITIDVDVGLVSENDVSVKLRIKKESFFEFEWRKESLRFCRGCELLSSLKHVAFNVSLGKDTASRPTRERERGMPVTAPMVGTILVKLTRPLLSDNAWRRATRFSSQTAVDRGPWELGTVDVGFFHSLMIRFTVDSLISWLYCFL